MAKRFLNLRMVKLMTGILTGDRNNFLLSTTVTKKSHKVSNSDIDQLILKLPFHWINVQTTRILYLVDNFIPIDIF